MRNIVSEQAYFSSHILPSKFKAETDRFNFESSEDAVTWNVFTAFARHKKLYRLLSVFTGRTYSPTEEPELYLWGLRIELKNIKENPQQLAQLKLARKVFEPDIRRYLTEPDVVLLLPGKLLLVTEVKLSSGNPVAIDLEVESGDKPRRKSEILARYSPTHLPAGVLRTNNPGDPFYTQLYRNLVFAIHMANQLKIEWHLTNLVSATQWADKKKLPEYTDPSGSIQELLQDDQRSRFTFRTWEMLWRDCIKNDTDLTDISNYMQNKTVGMARAFSFE